MMLKTKQGKILYTFIPVTGVEPSLRNTLLQACGRGIILRDLNLTWQKLADVNLSGLKAPGILLDNSEISNVCFDGADFRDGSCVAAKLVDVDLADVELGTMNLELADIHTSVLI